MADIFISYSSPDKDAIQRICDALKREKRDIWVNWEERPLTQTEPEIEAAHTCIFFISPHAIQSERCTQELEYAIQRCKRIIPIVLRDDQLKGVHPELARLNWVFFRQTDNFNGSFESLLKTLDTDLDHIKEHTRLQQLAKEWDKKQRNNHLLLRGSELEAAEQWFTTNAEIEPKPTQLQREYIDAGRQARTRGQRRLLAGVSVALGASVILGGVAFVQYLKAERLRMQAYTGQIISHSKTAEALFASGQGLEARLEALKAGRKLQNANWSQKDTQLNANVITALQQTVSWGRERNQLEGHTDRVWDVSYSADGEWMATASNDQTVKLWRPDGTLVRTLTGHTQQVRGVSFSPDGQTLLPVVV